MKKALSLLLIASLPAVSVVSAQVAEDISENEVIVATSDVESTTEVTEVTDVTDIEETTEVETLNAPTNTTAVNAVSTLNGEYKEVACNSDVIFSQNSCNQCFIGSKVSVGEKKTDIFDNWKNTTSDTFFTAVKSEQKLPELISFGSTWVPSNADASKIWSFHTDVSEAFVPAGNGSEEFTLNPNHTVRFYQTSLGAGYTLESTTKNSGDVVGMLKFPVVYYTQSASSGDRSSSNETHYECVAYTLDKPAEPTPAPKTPETPKEITKTETGPAETLVLIIAAFFIAFGLMISLRKRA